MQFRGHSLPVRQSMRVSWDFLARPISSANFGPRDFLSKLPLECVTSFRCITLNGILGRVEGQNTTPLYGTKLSDTSCWIIQLLNAIMKLSDLLKNKPSPYHVH